MAHMSDATGLKLQQQSGDKAKTAVPCSTDAVRTHDLYCTDGCTRGGHVGGKVERGARVWHKEGGVCCSTFV